MVLVLQYVLAFLDWSLIAAARGYFSDERDDGAERSADDAWRRGRAGQPLRTRSILLQVKGDWPELNDRLGFPSWNSTQRPCSMCAGFGESLYEVHGTTVHDIPWPLTADQDYVGACSKSRVMLLQHKTIEPQTT